MNFYFSCSHNICYVILMPNLNAGSAPQRASNEEIHDWASNGPSTAPGDVLQLPFIVQLSSIQTILARRAFFLHRNVVTSVWQALAHAQSHSWGIYARASNRFQLRTNLVFINLGRSSCGSCQSSHTLNHYESSNRRIMSTNWYPDYPGSNYSYDSSCYFISHRDLASFRYSCQSSNAARPCA